MVTKLQFETAADQVDIEDLWRAMTKEKIEVINKAAPELLTELRILEGDGFALGSLIFVSFGPDAPNVESFKERIVECDETQHLLCFQGIEGGYMSMGFTHYLVTFKLDDVGGGKTLITTSLAYELEQNVDGTRLLDGCLKLIHHYIDSLINFLKKNNV